MYNSLSCDAKQRAREALEGREIGNLLPCFGSKEREAPRHPQSANTPRYIVGRDQVAFLLIRKNSQRQRRTCYSLCYILYPVSAAHTREDRDTGLSLFLSHAMYSSKGFRKSTPHRIVNLLFELVIVNNHLTLLGGELTFYN